MHLRYVVILYKWLAVRMRIEDLGSCIWIHKLLNVNIISISAEEYRIRLYKFKVDNKLIYLMIRNDLVNWWAIYVDYWSSNITDREYISWSLINLASHVVLLGRIQDISFSAYILQTISIIFVFFAPILTLNMILSAIVHFLTVIFKSSMFLMICFTVTLNLVR